MTKTKGIPKGYKTNFETLKRAAANGDLALMQCRDRITQALTYVICAVGREGEDYILVPMARMFDGDPYDVLEPPDPGGGFYETEKR